MKVTNLRRVLCSLPLALPLLTTLAPLDAAAANCASPEERADRFWSGGWRIIQPQFVTVIAHRGFWGKYQSAANNIPENSLGAIRAAGDSCLDAVELDIKASSENVPMLMHDFNLGRTTNAYIFGGIQYKYNPEANRGFNPAVISVSAGQMMQLNLLTPDRSKNSGERVAPYEGALNYWKTLQNKVPTVLDVKTAAAARAVSDVTRRVLPNSGRLVTMKVNASLYTSKAAYESDVPNIPGIPVFVTNNLGKIYIPGTYDNWRGNLNPMEINVKRYKGILQVELDRAYVDRRAIGVFQAIPDYPGGGGRFYNADGSCCYVLADKYFTDPFTGVKENEDRRGDLYYLHDEGFTFVTTDDPVNAIAFFKSRGKR